MKYIAPAIAFATIATLVAQSAQARKDNFRVYNNTGYALQQLYISESGIEYWGRDVLGSNILSSGYNTGITFANMSPYTCLYDFRAVFSDGSVKIDSRVNVCANDSIQYH